MSGKKGMSKDDKAKEHRESDRGDSDEESEKAKSGKWTPELVRAAFQIQDMRDRRRSPDYRPDPRLDMDVWTWREDDGTESKGDKSAYITYDTYLTGRLETEPETIKAFRIQWEKKPQRAFTERGQDSYVFVGRHSRGFILTVYPTKLVDTSYGAHAYHTWWSIRIHLEGGQGNWKSSSRSQMHTRATTTSTLRERRSTRRHHT